MQSVGTSHNDAGTAATGFLPAEVTRLVGRRRELSEAKRLLLDSRLVTLAGMGGVGKTRLALRVAKESLRGFTDGVWLVELAELKDPKLLAHTVGNALGLQEQSGTGEVARLIECLAPRRLLLVLDNCEHLLEPCAGLVAELLRACPDLHVLATSRQALGAAGESVLRVLPLPFPDADRPHTARSLERYDAVTLFLDRARAADPHFESTVENLEAVGLLCSRLDGIPLALELAAVRVRSISLSDILARLGDPSRVLNVEQPGAPARHRTLRASIDSTFDLCSGEERSLWARLSTFAGSFDIDAVEGVCSDDGVSKDQILDLVASLVEKSIVAKLEDDHGRYQMLEVIRQYGEGRLQEAGETLRWARRHRDWYEKLASSFESSWMGPDQADLVRRMRREHANLRKALEFCVSQPGEGTAGMRMACALEPYWTARCVMSEGRLWLDRLLATRSSDRAARARALRLNAWLCILQGRDDDAEGMLEQARSMLGGVRDPVPAIFVTQTTGFLAMSRGDLPVAMSLFEEALAEFRTAGHHFGLVLTLFEAALAAGFAGELERAAAWHGECQRATKPIGERWFRSRSLWAMGLDAWRAGDHERAAALERESLVLRRHMDEGVGIASCLEALAWIAGSQGDGERAAVLLGAAEAIWRTIGMSLTAVPYLWSYRERGEALARNAVSDRAFQAAYARGLGMDTDQAVSVALGEPVVGTQPDRGASRAGALTRREQEISELVAEGLTNREIASRLVISPRTAEAHVENIRTKLGFSSRTQIAAWVIEGRVERR